MHYPTKALVSFALVFGLVLSAAAKGPVLPFTKFSEASSKVTVLGASVGACTVQGESAEVFSAAFKTPDGKDVFVYWYDPKSGRIVFGTLRRMGRTPT